jgi:FkbM family methyltransferase
VAPWAPTGYGQQTGIFTPRIAALGHDVCLSLYYGLQGSEFRWNGLRCLPSYSAAYGSDVIVPHALTHFNAEDAGSMTEASTRGLIITLGDVWTFESPLLDQMAVGSWTPIDHLAVPDVVRKWFEVMGAVPIAISRFGENALRDAGLNPMHIPHGIDTSIFRPGDKNEARAALGVPEDAFVVGMVANNVGRDGNRKAFAEQVAAFADLRRKHSDAMLVLHTDVDAPPGMRLRPFLERMLPKGSYTYTDQYAYRKGLSPAKVAEVHRSFDVLTNCSYGEGFGIPIVEAQACGTPVIVTDATAMTELCGSGWKVGFEPMWHDSQGAWAAKPRVGDIADAYELAYDKVDDAMRADAYTFGQQYDADLITETYWKPALERFQTALVKRAEEVHRAPVRTELHTKVVEADGLLWVDRGNKTGDALGWSDHEKELLHIVDSLLPEGGVFLDVGAHVGHYTLRLASKASRVYAVEANPGTASTLRRNLALNDIGNVVVMEMAAWDEEARLRLEDPGHQIDGGSTRVLPDENGEVQAHRLDAEYLVLNYADRVDLVKIDVEGADIHVINGLTGLLAKHKPTLFIECHDIYGYYQRADLEAALEAAGYGWETAFSYTTSWMPSGILNEPKLADYLVCKPREGT